MDELVDWPTVEAMFDELLSLPAPERAQALARGTEGRPELRQALESLLDHTDGADSLLDHPAIDAIAPEFTHAGALPAGARVGVYRIVELIGRGGMGEVYRAQRADGQFEQQVALKLMQRESAEHIERFHAERQILARLEHPGIARLHDGGLADDGRPYMVMELVDGRPILDWCRERRCTLVERLQLFMAICDAVAYAHRNLVVHRDLKPANVLVTKAGEIKLLDFGVAKLVDAQREDRTQNAPLTPAYAAPEQLTRGAVTTATDVYALGMVLFEVLSDARPWRLSELPLMAGLDKVLSEAPPAVSEVARRQAAAPVSPSLLRGDLDAIVAKALRKEPERRYDTVAALQADIAHSLRHEPVAARSGARLYVLGRFVRRHRLLIASGAVVTLAVAAGVIGVVWQARVARAEATRASAVQEFLVSIFRSNSEDQADPLRAAATTARELLDAGAARLSSPAGERLPPQARDELRGVIGTLYNELGMYRESAALLEARVASLRARGDAAGTELGMALVEWAASLQQTERAAAALPLLREAEAISARNPSDERLAGYVSSYLSNQLSHSDAIAAARYAERAVALLQRAEPDGDEMLGALFMVATAKRTTEPAAAEAAAAQALRLLTAHGRGGRALYCEAALVLAEIQASRMEKSAGETFKSAEAVALNVTAPGHYLRVQTDLRYGLYLADQGLADEAATRLNGALRAATAGRGADDSVYVAWAHENLAHAAWRRGRLQEAGSEADEALRIFGRQKPDDSLAKVAERAFDIAFARGDLLRARAFLDQARAARTLTGTVDAAGFRELVVLREAWLTLASGDAQQALQIFDRVFKAGVPPLQRFIENQLSAGVGAARSARLLGNAVLAAKYADGILRESERLDNPAPLRQVNAQAWIELAAAKRAIGECAAARNARNHAIDLLGATDDSSSFRQSWLTAADDGCA